MMLQDRFFKVVVHRKACRQAGAATHVQPNKIPKKNILIQQVKQLDTTAI
jgi:hypothetical protein